MSSKSPRLIVAMDIPEKERAFELAEKLKGMPVLLKIHWVLYPLIGHDGLRRIADMFEGRIFLDFKMHDIPSVISKGVENLMRTIPFEIITLHVAGGDEMLRMTFESRDKCFKEGSACKKKPILLGVTVMTSLSTKDLVRTGSRFTSPLEAVLALTDVAHSNGMDGVVASVHEAFEIKQKFGTDFRVLTPGIRPSGSSSDDQARIATPLEAKKQGSDFIVVGRPITQAKDPVSVVEQILHELNQ